MSHYPSNYYPVWPHTSPSYSHASTSYYNTQAPLPLMDTYTMPYIEHFTQPHHYHNGQYLTPGLARAPHSVGLPSSAGVNDTVDRSTIRSTVPNRPLGNLRPSDVDCRWWKKGYCARGTTCFFKHDPSVAGVDVRRRTNGPRRNYRETLTVLQPNQEGARDTTATEDTPPPLDAPSHSTSEEECSVCKEMPQTYGLLVNCYHCFCLDCIRIWRASGNKAVNSDDRNGESCNWKQCPICRKYSDYVIPSSIFPTPVFGKGLPANPAKEELIKGYLAKLKEIPCRYFEDSIKRQYQALETGAGRPVSQRHRSGRRGHANNRFKDDAILGQIHPQCRFGNDCHYAHIDPQSKRPYVFSIANVQQLRLERDRVVRETAEQRRIWAVRQARAAEAREEIISHLESLMNAGLELARQAEPEPAC